MRHLSFLFFFCTYRSNTKNAENVETQLHPKEMAAPRLSQLLPQISGALMPIPQPENIWVLSCLCCSDLTKKEYELESTLHKRHAGHRLRVCEKHHTTLHFCLCWQVLFFLHLWIPPSLRSTDI